MGFIKKNRGFSLVETMITLGIMMGSLVVLSMVMIDHRKNINRLESNLDLTQFVQWSNTALETSESICSSAISGHTFNLAQASTDEGMPIDLNIPVGATSIQLGADQVVPQYNLIVNNLTLRNAQDTGLGTAGENIYTANITADLSTTRVVSGKQEMGTHEIASIVIRVNGTVTGCVSFDNNTGEQIADICTGLGGFWDAPSRECLPPDNNANLCTGGLGGRWVNGSCVAMPSMDSFCRDLGFTWSGGRCMASSSSGAGGSGGGTCAGNITLPPGSEGQGYCDCSGNTEGGSLGGNYLCIAGAWVWTGSCAC